MFATDLHTDSLNQSKSRKTKKGADPVHAFRNSRLKEQRSTSHLLDVNNLFAFRAAAIGSFLAACVTG